MVEIKTIATSRNFDEEIHLMATSILRHLTKFKLMEHNFEVFLNSKSNFLTGKLNTLHGLEKMFIEEFNYDQRFGAVVTFLRNIILAKRIQLVMEDIVQNYNDFDQLDLINREYKINKMIGLEYYEVRTELRGDSVIFVVTTMGNLDEGIVNTFLHIDPKYNIVLKIKRDVSLFSKPKEKVYNMANERENFRLAMKMIVKEGIENEINNKGTVNSSSIIQ